MKRRKRREEGRAGEVRNNKDCRPVIESPGPFPLYFGIISGFILRFLYHFNRALKNRSIQSFSPSSALTSMRPGMLWSKIHR